MPTTPATEACPACGAALRPNAVYCRECGAMNAAAPVLQQAAFAQSDPDARPTAVPTASARAQRSSVAHADRSTARRPRWALGTFWALVTLVLAFAGVVGPGKWLLLLALATGAYSVYLYRGGRYGVFFI